MTYCTEQLGMNQPLYIQPNQYTTNPQPEQTTPPGDINPTSTTPGLNFPPTAPNPQINITLDQPSTITVIYMPTNTTTTTDQPPPNVSGFQLQFLFPNKTLSIIYISTIPTITTTSPTTTTTTTASGWYSITNIYNTNFNYNYYYSSIKSFTYS